MAGVAVDPSWRAKISVRDGLSRSLSAMPFSPKRVGSVAYSLVMFVVVSVLAGVLIAGLFVPLPALAGCRQQGGRRRAEQPAGRARDTRARRPGRKVLMANGKMLAYFYDENRIPVKLDQIAPVMRQAQLAIEDHRFYEHGALDFKGTLRALVRNSAGDGVTQGGSSITQQYVKMVQIEACQAKAATTPASRTPRRRPWSARSASCATRSRWRSG